MKMHNPPHPGVILREMYIEPLGINITEAAFALHISRQTLSELVNCHIGVSVEMAIRLSRAFKSTPEYWLNLQNQYDLWHAINEKDFGGITQICAAAA
ncbi:MAG: HigA family addiction module antidote protein [Gammaproteobacteria bacterium]|nr:HigA family addiction module antidote protein [Gammaproteobacteria bacterium]